VILRDKMRHLVRDHSRQPIIPAKLPIQATRHIDAPGRQRNRIGFSTSEQAKRVAPSQRRDRCRQALANALHTGLGHRITHDTAETALHSRRRARPSQLLPVRRIPRPRTASQQHDANKTKNESSQRQVPGRRESGVDLRYNPKRSKTHGIHRRRATNRVR
jgi:hypothetical protein